MSLIKKYIFIFPIIGLVLLDQLLKIYIPKDFIVIDGILKFTYIENTGGAFGVFSSDTLTVILFNIIALWIIIKFAINQREIMPMISKCAVIFILGGGISNFIDRIFRGFVIDFIDITPMIQFPIFNLADVMLTTGWICFGIGIIIFMKKGKGKNEI